MKNLEQIRAANAIKYKDEVFPGSDGGEVVKKVPAMIRENGFLAAAAFALEKKGNGDYKNPGHKKVFDCILGHLAHSDVKKTDKANLEGFVIWLTEKSSAELREITDESLAYLNYLRRFARKKSEK